MDPNEPIRTVNFDQLHNELVISIENWATAYVFVGKTPKAQFIIKNPTSSGILFMSRLREVFPTAVFAEQK